MGRYVSLIAIDQRPQRKKLTLFLDYSLLALIRRHRTYKGKRRINASRRIKKYPLKLGPLSD